jgi:DNA replication protein DnaC
MACYRYSYKRFRLLQRDISLMGRTKTCYFAFPKTTNQEENVASVCKMLDLGGIAKSYKNVAERMNQKHGTLYDFLENLLEKELVYKEENRIGRWIQQAHFPFKKTVAEFDFTFQPSIDERLINEITSCRYIEEGKNIIFLGPPGVGKTHLSIGLGLEAIYRGFETKFLKLDEFIEKVEKETEANASSKIFKTYARPRLLIIDDIDYYYTGNNAGTVLFKLICQRHQMRVSTIFTSNKKLSEWGDLFGSKERAGAALDRIIGISEIINIIGESYRMKDKLKKIQTMNA